jgi:isoquinoline 1-oxidoreductase
LKSVDVEGARTLTGARVIQDGNFIAVVHPTSDGAASALQRIKADFAVPQSEVNDGNILEHLMAQKGQGRVVEQKGDLANGRELAALKFDETYFTPYIAHAPIETHSALAQVGSDETTVWVSTQRPFGVQQEVARAIGMPEDKVRVITPLVGGGFGGKSAGPQRSKPHACRSCWRRTQIAWSRRKSSSTTRDPPAAFVKISSGSTRQPITFWDFRCSSPATAAPEMISRRRSPRTVSTGSFGGGGRIPSPPVAWRGRAAIPTSSPVVHIDIMAARVGMDPVEFRLKNLADSRMARVLRAAADTFKWTPARPPSKRGYGVALLDYLNTCVAAMAEVAVDKATGQIRVKRVTVAQDLGQVVNPEGPGSDGRLHRHGAVVGAHRGDPLRRRRHQGPELRQLRDHPFLWVPDRTSDHNAGWRRDAGNPQSPAWRPHHNALRRRMRLFRLRAEEGEGRLAASTAAIRCALTARGRCRRR